jgi:hypothetical protein
VTRENAAVRDVPAPLRGFIDRVVVPALLERFLHEMKRADGHERPASEKIDHPSPGGA